LTGLVDLDDPLPSTPTLPAVHHPLEHHTGMEPNTAREMVSTQRTLRRVAGATAETDLRPGVSVEHGEQESK